MTGAGARSRDAAELTSLGSRRLAALAAPARLRRACGLAAVPGAPAGGQHTTIRDSPGEVNQRVSLNAVLLRSSQSPASTQCVKGA